MYLCLTRYNVWSWFKPNFPQSPPTTLRPILCHFCFTAPQPLSKWTSPITPYDNKLSWITQYYLLTGIKVSFSFFFLFSRIFMKYWNYCNLSLLLTSGSTGQKSKCHQLKSYLFTIWSSQKRVEFVGQTSVGESFLV